MSNLFPGKRFNLELLKQKGLLKRASQIKGEKLKSPCSLKKVFPEGEYIDTPYKKVFKVEKSYSPDTRLGRVKTGDIYKFSDNFAFLFSILGKNENLKEFQFRNLLLFDVESTGLTSGAGNMVFLIGLGFFNEQKEFIVHQYFIEDYINEKGLLYILKDIFKEKNHLISYNGKSFDFHILENRFILSRKFEFSLNNLMHFDLLHSCRRMWKNIFVDNSLGNLEKQVLQFIRDQKDIPGFQVPEYYKDYLKSGNAELMEGIFYHNLMDVRSMLGLLIVQLNNLQNILEGDFPDNVNINSMASLLYHIDKKLSFKMLHYVCDRGDSKVDSLKQLYLYYKKDGQKNRFHEILHRMIETNKKFNYFPYCELSKYYEHDLKQPHKALEIITQAQNRINHLTALQERDYNKEIDDIIKRKERLSKKCLKK